MEFLPMEFLPVTLSVPVHTATAGLNFALNTSGVTHRIPRDSGNSRFGNHMNALHELERLEKDRVKTSPRPISRAVHPDLGKCTGKIAVFGRASAGVQCRQELETLG